jgi:uncharacterized membrane protein
MSDPRRLMPGQPSPSAPGGRSGPAGAAGGAAVERRIARLLEVGTLIAIGLLGVGSVLLVMSGTSPLDPDWPPLDLGELPADLLALRPEGFLWLGLLVTIGTPIMRVVAATIGFAGAGERRMVALGIGVLVVLGLAIVAGSTGA